MAIPAATVWEVRPTNGTDTNGAGFVAGAAGTDYSQQNAKNTSGNNISTTDVVATGSTTITSATAAFTSAIVGNVIYLQGGTGSLTAGWYQVATYSNATTIVLDRAVATGTGITMNIGGALATLTQAAAVWGGSNKVFVKNESTLQIASGISLGAVGGSISVSSPPSIIQGYSTTRGDSGRFTLQLITNTGQTALTSTGNQMGLVNAIIDCNSLGTSTGFSSNGYSFLYNCLVKNFTTAGFTCSGNGGAIWGCEFTGGSSAATAAINATAGEGFGLYNSYVHDNACPGVIALAGAVTIARNLICNNTGASSDGLRGPVSTAGNYVDLIINNTIYGNGRHGIFYNGTAAGNRVILNNILSNNGGYGINMASSAGIRAFFNFDGNAYYSNTSGNRNNMDDTTTNKQNGVAPYTNVSDVFPASSPFVAAASYNWNLNQNSSGAAIRGYGVPKTWPAISGSNASITTSFVDMGAVEHQDPGFAG